MLPLFLTIKNYCYRMLASKEKPMRLWHYKLIPFLPKSQLIAQWRELNSIFKKQDNHILINYVYEYPKEDLMEYTCRLLREMRRRDITIKSKENMNKYFGKEKNEIFNNLVSLRKEYKGNYIPFRKHHNNRYLIQCYFNLQEKYDRGQKDFSGFEFMNLEDFVSNEIHKN